MLHADALPRVEYHASARLNHVFDAIDAEVYGCRCHLLVFVCVVQFDDQIAASTVDDIFHLGPVEVHRRLLFLLHDHDFLCVGFLVHAIFSVAQGEEEESSMQEVARPKVGDVPAQHTFGDVIHLSLMGFPVVHTPCCPLGQHELARCEELLGVAHDLIDFTAFHDVIGC